MLENLSNLQLPEFSWLNSSLLLGRERITMCPRIRPMGRLSKRVHGVAIRLSISWLCIGGDIGPNKACALFASVCFTHWPPSTTPTEPDPASPHLCLDWQDFVKHNLPPTITMASRSKQWVLGMSHTHIFINVSHPIVWPTSMTCYLERLSVNSFGLSFSLF